MDPAVPDSEIDPVAIPDDKFSVVEEENTLDEVGQQLGIPIMKEEKGKFRLQVQRVHLTYKTHIDPSEWLSTLGKTLGVEHYSFAREIGETKYVHTHILIRMKKTPNIRKANTFDFNKIHPNIRKVNTDEHWVNCIEYHKKQDANPYTNCNENFCGRVWSHRSVADALEAMVDKDGRNAPAIVAVYAKKPPVKKSEPHVEWREWQQELYDELQKTPDDRSIVWYWDRKGSNGKTMFAKHMIEFKDAFVSTNANIYHAATILQDAINKGSPINTVIFNFTRQTEQHKIYQALEEFKDGLVTAQKYRSQTLTFPSPHVIVFANYLPEIMTMSLDRWKIRVISATGLKVSLLFGEEEIINWIETQPDDIRKNNKELSRRFRIHIEDETMKYDPMLKREKVGAITI